jgi:Anti-sigma-D factor RsdA to sigma factor binding region
MGERRFRGSGFDMLPLGDFVDLAAVAADDALIDALSARTPGAVPPAGDPVAELLAAWAADARCDLPAWDALSAPVIRDVPVGPPSPVSRQPQRQSCPLSAGNRAWLARWLRAATE